MTDHFRAEVLRFRSWAIAYAVLHLAVLGFLARVMDLAQQSQQLYQQVGLAYALSGVLLGAYQMGSYRKPSAWLNLLHRPVSPGRIAAGLTAAAGVLLLFGVLVPPLLIALWQELFTARVVDVRHLGLGVSGWLLSVCGYLAGAFAMLAPRRFAVAPAAVLFGLIYASASGPYALALQALAAGWLAAMVRVACKPDLSAPPRGIAGTVLVALPLQVSLWVGLGLLGLVVETAMIVGGTHPNVVEVPPPGSVKEADRAHGRDLIIAGLQGSAVPDAPLWREQVAISEVHTIRPSLDGLPVRGQLTNPAPLSFEDPTRRVRWTFSHDRMRFEGQSLATRGAAGTLPLEGGAPFTEPPVPLGRQWVVTRGALHQFDEETGRLRVRTRLPEGEQLIGVEELNDRLGVLSHRALYLYELRDVRDTEGLLTPRLRVPLPGHAGNLTRVDLTELIDGVLVSFTLTRGRYDGYATAFQEVVRADEAGTASVGRRDLRSGYPGLLVYARWYASPLVSALGAAVERAFSGYQLEQDVAHRPIPRRYWAVALALSLLSLLIAAWRTQRLALSPVARAGWLIACGVVGLPALLSLWFLYPPRDRLDALPVPAAAVAA